MLKAWAYVEGAGQHYRVRDGLYVLQKLAAKAIAKLAAGREVGREHYAFVP